MKRKVLPTPAEAKAETFSEKYDDPTARPTTSFESGNPMRKGCANKNKDDYILYYQAFETSDPTRLFAACAMHENKKGRILKSGLSRRSDFGYERQC